MRTLIRLYKWFKDRKTGFYVGVYDCELDTWVKAYSIGGDRYLVTQGNWELKLSSPTGYQACLEGTKWFNSLNDTFSVHFIKDNK